MRKQREAELFQKNFEVSISLFNIHHVVFELRKNKCLSHRQPGYNLWLSIQVFGCPILEYINIHVQR